MKAVVVGLVALAVRLGHLASLVGTTLYLAPPLDGEVYLATAHRPIEGVYFQSPGYVAFLKAIFVFSDGPLLFRLVQCGLGAGTAALTVVIAARVVSARWAVLAGLGVALCGPLVVVDGWPALESLNVFLQTAACAALLATSDERRRVAWSAVAGLCLGAAVLVRPSALVLTILAAGWLVSQKRLRLAALTVAVAGLTVAPVTLHNLTAGDSVLVTASGGLNFYLGNGQGADGVYRVPALLPGASDALRMAEVSQTVAERSVGKRLRPSEVSAWFYDQTWRDIGHDRAAWLRLLGRKALLAVNWFEAPCSEDYYLERSRSPSLRAAFVTFGLLAPLALLGTVVVLRRRSLPGVLILVFVAATMATLLVYFYLGRYRLPTLPFVAVLAAVGGEAVLALVRKKQWLRVTLSAALLVAAAVVIHLHLIRPDPAQELVKVGVAAIRLGRLDEAAVEFERALQADPDRIQALQNLAVLRGRAGRTDEAHALWLHLRDVARRTNNPRALAVAEAALAR